MNYLDFGPESIVAIKNITPPGERGFVYFGAASTSDTPNRGAWSSAADLCLATPAASPDGKIGDFLAVSSKRRFGNLQQIHGKLVALQQHGVLTHLAVVHSRTVVEAVEPGTGYRWFVWLHVLGMAPPAGLQVARPRTALPWSRPGGAFCRIDRALAPSLAAQLRGEIWSRFIESEGQIVTAHRAALRP